MNLSYEWIPSGFVQGNEYYERIVKECSELFSTQYGKWSQAAPYNPGKNVKLSPKRLYEWLDDDNATLYFAKDNDLLVGYAIALQLNVPKYGVISWVTQLVVHEMYRHQDVAKNILRSIWGFSDNYAWGIISANPYAIRALEKTTRRRSDPIRIKHNLRKLISIGIKHLTYINEKTETFVTSEVSKINTEFYVDHSDVPEMIENVISDEAPWLLGELEEGWEWLAFTFRDQLPFELTEEEIDTILDTSDRVVRNAYKRMDVSEGNHIWAKNTKNEVDYIVKECGLKPYIDKNIEVANTKKDLDNSNNTVFFLGDCRDISLNCQADAVICLYDVIGSFADDCENQRILNNLVKHLKPGGVALISVMNYELTLSQAKNKFKLSNNPDALLSLKPCNIMERSGNIFDPEYYLVDEETGLVYRREQFKRGRALPVELIVRDRRYKMETIKHMCEQSGLIVENCKYVSARDWNNSLDLHNKSAKEILLKCRKKGR